MIHCLSTKEQNAVQHRQWDCLGPGHPAYLRPDLALLLSKSGRVSDYSTVQIDLAP